jgi:hypothetical protein
MATDAWKPYPAMKLGALSENKEVISNKTYLYAVDLTNIKALRVRPINIVGGLLSCYGRGSVIR